MDAIAQFIPWNGYIIDGHHRYEICMRHKLNFRVDEKHFEKERDVRKSCPIPADLAALVLASSSRLRLASRPYGRDPVSLVC